MKKALLLALLLTMLCTSAMADSILLTNGYYVVGQDISAGGYNIIVGEFGTERTGWCSVYLDKTKMQENTSLVSGNIPIGAEPFHVNLEDGNVVSVSYLPLLFSTEEIKEEDYPAYEPPEGTLVVTGIYRGGIDIPAGTYQVYSAKAEAGYIIGYRTEEAYQDDKDSTYHFDRDFTVDYYPTKPEKIAVVEVEEGNVLLFNGDAIMRKPPKLTFE